MAIPIESKVRCFENEIDQSVCRLFQHSDRFVSWFFNKLRLLDTSLVPEGRVIHVSGLTHVHDVGAARRETDIQIDCEIVTRRVRVLIEDKVLSPFGYNQARDYQSRSAKAVHAGHCDHCVTVLIAPQSYMATGGAEQFNARIAFEDLLVAIDSPDNVPEDAHVEAAEILRRAIKTANDGYIRIVDLAWNRQIAWYAELANEIAPQLRLRTKDGAPSDSIDMYFWPVVELWNIKHSLMNGLVVLEVYNAWHLRERIEQELGPSLPNGCRIMPPPSARQAIGVITGLHIGFNDLSRTARFRGLQDQVDAVAIGIQRADELRQFCVKNESALASITMKVRADKKR